MNKTKREEEMVPMKVKRKVANKLKLLAFLNGKSRCDFLEQIAESMDGPNRKTK